MAGVGKLICSSTLLKFRSTKNQTANHLCLWRARYKIEEGPGAKEKDIQDAFGKIDKDKSGSINKEVPCILNNPDFQVCHQKFEIAGVEAFNEISGKIIWSQRRKCSTQVN